MLLPRAGADAWLITELAMAWDLVSLLGMQPSTFSSMMGTTFMRFFLGLLLMLIWGVDGSWLAVFQLIELMDPNIYVFTF